MNDSKEIKNFLKFIPMILSISFKGIDIWKFFIGNSMNFKRGYKGYDKNVNLPIYTLTINDEKFVIHGYEYYKKECNEFHIHIYQIKISPKIRELKGFKIKNRFKNYSLLIINE